jgi:hypothetical protein
VTGRANDLLVDRARLGREFSCVDLSQVSHDVSLDFFRYNSEKIEWQMGELVWRSGDRETSNRLTGITKEMGKTAICPDIGHRLYDP